MSQKIVYDLTKADEINDYYRSYLTGDPDKDQMILGLMRERNRHKTVGKLTAAMFGTTEPGPSYIPKG